MHFKTEEVKTTNNPMFAALKGIKEQVGNQMNKNLQITPLDFRREEKKATILEELDLKVSINLGERWKIEELSQPR